MIIGIIVGALLAFAIMLWLLTRTIQMQLAFLAYLLTVRPNDLVATAMAARDTGPAEAGSFLRDAWDSFRAAWKGAH